MPRTKLFRKTFILAIFILANLLLSSLSQKPNEVSAATYWFIRNVGGTVQCISASIGGDLPHYNSQASCESALAAGAGVGSGETTPGGSGGDSSIPCQPTCSIGGVLEFDVGDSGGQTVTTILMVSISIAAVIAFILAGFGAVQIVASAGNPTKINQGREMIISAISGLLFIIFAVSILEIIGANILNLPGIEGTSDIYDPTP